jgi:hypothetical protein
MLATFGALDRSAAGAISGEATLHLGHFFGPHCLVSFRLAPNSLTGSGDEFGASYGYGRIVVER